MNDERELEQIERLIENVEKELSELKVAVRRIKGETSGARERNLESPRGLELGCKARITNNLRPLQEREGKVIKLNRDTNRVTVQGKRRKGKVVRALENVIRIERYTGE